MSHYIPLYVFYQDSVRCHSNHDEVVTWATSCWLSGSSYYSPSGLIRCLNHINFTSTTVSCVKIMYLSDHNVGTTMDITSNSNGKQGLHEKNYSQIDSERITSNQIAYGVRCTHHSCTSRVFRKNGIRLSLTSLSWDMDL